MHLLNAAIAVTSALAGTIGATVAYGTLNTPPTERAQPKLEPVVLTHYLPCEPPSTLTDGVCVTTVVRTVVKTIEPEVITTYQSAGPSKVKGRSASSSRPPDKSASREDHDDDDEDEDEHDEREDEDDEHEDDEHEDDED